MLVQKITQKILSEVGIQRVIKLETSSIKIIKKVGYCFEHQIPKLVFQLNRAPSKLWAMAFEELNTNSEQPPASKIKGDILSFEISLNKGSDYDLIVDKLKQLINETNHIHVKLIRPVTLAQETEYKKFLNEVETLQQIAAKIQV